MLRDPATIKFQATSVGTDRLKVGGLIYPPTALDPNAEVVAIRLSNANGVVYSAELAPGEFVQGRRTFKYRNKAAKTDPAGGIMYFAFLPHHKAYHSAAAYRLRIIAYGNLSAATLDTMTLELVVGEAQFQHSAVWSRTLRGDWRDSGIYELLP
jgi:hypothetical protein